ncbi:microsomal glutathione S-transferase 1-like [Macrobrachium rosenbergii]|uniref:microsomal glutathione S-transferase 1-like n=1 Tax=Macrobrachium rosenbergii TaxID=79674 RepID=UPI0034D77F44
MGGWSLDNPVFANYVFFSGVLALKVLLMSCLTAYYRVTKRVFFNQEDAKVMGVKELRLNDPDVERVRRAHQNDIENIPVFWILGLLYILTDPSESVSKMLFRVFTLCRIIHTVLYLSESNKRPIPFFVAMAIKIFMAGTVIITFMK